MPKFCFYFIFITFFIFPSLVFSSDESSAVQSFIDHGVQNLELNKIQPALFDFARALLLEPSNPRVREHLLGMTARDDLIAQQKIQLVVWEDLMKLNERLTENIFQWQEKNDGLARMLDMSGIKYSLGPDSDNVESMDKESLNMLFGLSLETLSESEILEWVNKTLLEEKDRLSKRFLFLQKQNQELTDLAKAHQINPIEEVVTPASGDYDFKSEISAVREELKEIRSYVQERYAKVNSLTKQVVDFSLRLSEQEAQNLQKDKDALVLKNKVEELKERIVLSQRIMAQRDEELLLLQTQKAKIEEKISRQTNSLNGLIDKKNEQLTELSGFLDIYRAKYYEAHHALESKEQEIKSLRLEMFVMKSQLDKINSYFAAQFKE